MWPGPPPTQTYQRSENEPVLFQLHPLSHIQGAIEELSDTLLAVGANGRTLTLLSRVSWQGHEETQSPKNQTAQKQPD